MNNNHFGRTAVLVLFALLLASWLFLPWPQPAQNDLAGVTIEVGQEEFARQYALGLLYEQEGKWEAAQTAYGEALLAGQSEIRQAADNSLRRSLASENSWLWAWQSSLNWLGRVVLIAIVFGLVLMALGFFRRNRNPQPGYLIKPVYDFTKDGMGNGIHHLLALQLQSIRQAQENAVKMFRTQSLAAGLFPILTPWEEMSEEVTNALAVLDKVNIAGIDVNIRPFAQTIHRIWRKQEYTVTTHLHQRGNRLYLHIDLQHYRDHQRQRVWNILGDPATSLLDQKEALFTEMTYQLLVSQAGHSLGTSSWRSLQAYFDGLVLWQRYQDDGRFSPGLLEEAAQKFQQAQYADPSFKPSQFALGTIYNAQGLYEKAETIFNTLMVEHQNSLPLHYNLGVSYYHQVEKGRWGREKAAKQFSTIQNVLEKQTANNESEKTLLALTYSGLAMVGAFEVYYENRSEWVLDKDRARLEVVQTYTSKSRHIAEQIEDENIQKIIFASADHADGFAYLQAKQLELARDLLQQAIKKRPDYPVPYANLATTYKNEPEQAFYWLERSVAIQPGFAYGWYQLGELFYKDRANPVSIEKARDAYHKATGFADAQDRLGTIAFKDGDYGRALEHYLTAVQLNSQKEYIWRNMAWRTLQAVEEELVLASKDILENALIWASQSVELTKDSDNDNAWRAYDVQGWAFRLLNMPDKALAAFQKSIELNKNAQNLYHRAQVYAQINNMGDMQANLDEAKNCKYFETWKEAIHNLKRKMGFQS